VSCAREEGRIRFLGELVGLHDRGFRVQIGYLGGYGNFVVVVDLYLSVISGIVVFLHFVSLITDDLALCT
jgi:hypothetical protein